MDAKTVLDVRKLRKSFGGVQALRQVDFELKAGEIHGLCGENGAGKSTLVKILGGLIVPTEGEITVDGVALRPGRRTDPRLISIVFQELSIIPDLSVLDNVLLGDEIGEIYLRGRHVEPVRRQLDALGLSHIDVHQPARELTLAEQQLVEIARGVLRGARILILDEPTATLSDNEIKRVFTAVRWLRDQGSTVVFITHRLAEVFDLTDRVTVFRNGERVMTRPTAGMTTAELVSAMIGREIAPRQVGSGAAKDAAEAPALKLAGLFLPGKYSGIDLSIQRGEIVAVVGQLGSGADLLIETVAGLRRGYGGAVSLDGAAIEVRSIKDAMRHRIAYVAEDRAGKGVFLDATVETNMSASILARISRAGFLRKAMGGEIARQLAGRFQIDPSRLPGEVSQLSGGNQQKVALAKAVAVEPRILVLNEPTRGVDIGARSEIYKQLRQLAEAGIVVLFFTTDIEEVQELADRVVAIFRGRVVSDRRIGETTMDAVLSDILHGPKPKAVAA
jgi:ABC-type sugar transport system ATPase subunit